MKGRSNAAIDDAARLVLDVPEDRFPILFVETTRANAESVVRKMAEVSAKEGDRWRNRLADEIKAALDDVADMADNTMGDPHDLGNLIRQGLVYHHAGVPPHLLAGIEDLIRRGAIRAVGSTTTVAEGADLPFQIVVIPHLNFGGGGSNSKLERDLYNNIVGRAGRANVAIEGVAILIGSSAPSLVHHVERELWNEDSRAPLKGYLQTAFDPISNIQEYRARREVKSQVLAWLGDQGSYVENQASELASSTFTSHTSTNRDREFVAAGIAGILNELESEGLAEAASPFRLTSLGKRSRLAGISPNSCRRLATRLDSLWLFSIPDALNGISEISDDLAGLLASIVFETEEVIDRSIWYKRLDVEEEDSVQVLRKIATGERSWPYDDPLYSIDLQILAAWIRGRTYREIGDIPPVFGGRGAFGSSRIAQRTSDAAEHLNRISSPAAWAWSGTVAMLGDEGEAIPGWIHGAFEYGISTETGVELMRQFGVSRSCASGLATALSQDWGTAQFELAELSQRDLRKYGVTGIDRRLLWAAEDQL